MIQPEPEDLPKDNPKLEIAVLRCKLNLAFFIKTNALIESRAKRSIKISLGHIPFQTLVEHHQVHKLLSRVLRNIIVIFARTFRVILFSIHNDEWKSFQCHHQTALRYAKCMSMLEAFKIMQKYEHVGQRHKIARWLSRSQSMKEQDYNEDKDQEHSSLNDKSNLTDLMKECHQ
ncbi:hypothetical protein Tco_0662155 [Tanacetum coccineum]